MCATCGCGTTGSSIRKVGDLEHARLAHDHHHHGAPGEAHAHDHAHGHDHGHDHTHPPQPRTVSVEESLLAKNDASARRNRRELSRRRITAVNVMGGPGAGKTTLLEATIQRLSGVEIAVIEGDQETERDGARIRAAGSEVVQINTGAGCHLDADMVRRGVAALGPASGSLLFVENVGNLVCPALFDLGERARVVVMSVTEGEDKPLKYPHMFRAADVFVLTKIDLLPHLRFDVDECLGLARQVNPRLRVLQTSSESGEGLDLWCAWLRDTIEAAAVSS